MPRENLRIAPPSDLQSLDRTPVARLGSTIPVFGAGKMTRHRKACHPRSIEREAKFGSDKVTGRGEGAEERMAAKQRLRIIPFRALAARSRRRYVPSNTVSVCDVQVVSGSRPGGLRSIRASAADWPPCFSQSESCYHLLLPPARSAGGAAREPRADSRRIP